MRRHPYAPYALMCELFVIYNVCVECCNLVEKQKWHIKYIYIYINLLFIYAYMYVYKLNNR